MENHQAPADEPVPTRGGLFNSPWRYTLLAVVLGALVLGYEYREAIFTSGLLLYLPILLCLGMHFFMHRGHKGTGGRNEHD
ncbi:DUF2933 domain-containing protein [Citreimonas salinaria]|uniref:DUF2933 domain-containing protein n=1 Tax=Citreimonas salinaria TaxID=321339 RepID=A0A1H3MZE1_9RHOB|nr:DUF2933 domain-containing protein [Citreimonas salinaria]SDY81874.1 Protein of unknown function [Citreimonas salinaria]